MNNAAIFSRLTAEWKTKLLMGGILTCAFWIGYFLLQRYPVFPVRVMPVLIIDRLVPFVPGAAPIYVSQFATMSVLAWLTPSKDDLYRFCRGIGLISGVGFLVFFFFPTSIVRPGFVPGHDFFYDLVVRFDGTINACPSLHAAFGVFLVAYAPLAFRGLKFKTFFVGVVWACTASVLASTLLTRQHVFLDVIAGGVLGAAAWLILPKSGKRFAATGGSQMP